MDCRWGVKIKAEFLLVGFCLLSVFIVDLFGFRGGGPFEATDGPAGAISGPSVASNTPAHGKRSVFDALKPFEPIFLEFGIPPTPLIGAKLEK